jgi:hypothetical protein
MSSVITIDNTMLNDDIIDCFKNHIYIKDYDKLKIVCSKYKRYFCLKKLICCNKYSKLINIKGCTIEIFIYIICKNVLKKLDYDVKKKIIEQIIKRKNEFTLDNYSNGLCCVLNYIVELYNNCYQNDIKNIIKLLEKFIYFCNEKIDINNFTYFTNPIISYIDDIQEGIITIQSIQSNVNYNNTNNENNKKNDIINMLLYINLNLFLTIILKNIKIIIPSQYTNFQNLDILLYMFQSEKIKLIKYNIQGHLFPDYYVDYVIKLTDKLYV